MMHRLPISVSFLLAAGATASEVTSGDASALFLRGSSEGNEEVYVRLAENSVQVQQLRSKFLEWVHEHKKLYSDATEEMRKMLVWIENHEFIERHNSSSPPPSYTLGHNAFSDLTGDEFQQVNNLGKYAPGVDMTARIKRNVQKKLSIGESEEEAIQRRLGARSSTSEDSADFDKNKDIPTSVDWVAKGAVTDVKNQGQCGACWAFSAIGALEAAHFLKYGELVALSEQELLDCDIKDHGCFGGLMDIAFEFDESGRGVCKEDDYPYLADKNDSCLKECEPVDGTLVKSFVDVPEGNYHALKRAIVKQPTSIAIQANQMSFQFYKDGVFDDDECGEEAVIDHGVLAVGYDTNESGQKFWMVKNSWGETWGDNGYIKLSRKSENEFGMCSILKMASYPELV